MSKKHPVVAVTGSSGSGTTFVKQAFENIFCREGIIPAVVEGDSFHSLSRKSFIEELKKAANKGNNNFSHFGPEANDFASIENTFRIYGETGSGKKRYYLHNVADAAQHNERLGCNKKSGEFTPWEDIAANSDLLFYEGLHGLAVDEAQNINIPDYVDLGVGVVPSVNLE